MAHPVTGFPTNIKARSGIKSGDCPACGNETEKVEVLVATPDGVGLLYKGPGLACESGKHLFSL